jgi:hypothetical protein
MAPISSPEIHVVDTFLSRPDLHLLATNTTVQREPDDSANKHFRYLCHRFLSPSMTHLQIFGKNHKAIHINGITKI